MGAFACFKEVLFLTMQKDLGASVVATLLVYSILPSTSIISENNII